MAELRELQRFIENTRALGEIVQAMRNLAGVYVRRAESTIQATRPYREVVESALAAVLAAAAWPVLEEDTETPAVLVVFASDQGLCGTFNEHVVSCVTEFVAEHAGIEVMVIGRRGRDLLRQRGIAPCVDSDAPTSLEGIKARVADLSERLFQAFSAAGAERLFFAYNRYESMGRFQPVVRRVLPPTREDLAAEPAIEFRSDPILTAPPDQLLGRFMEEYFFINLFGTLLESHGSENGARLLAMTAAAANIDKRLVDLTKKYQNARQEMVTSELLDVVGGAEALQAQT